MSDFDQQIQEDLDILDKYVKPHLSKKGFNILRKGCQTRNNILWDRYLHPNLLGSNEWRHGLDELLISETEATCAEHAEDVVFQNSMYIAVESNFLEPGKNSKLSHTIKEVQDFIDSPTAGMEVATYFTNYMREPKTETVPDPKRPGCTRLAYESPKERVIGADFWVFTYEYDADKDWSPEDKIGLLDRQLCNAVGASNKTSNLDNLYQHLSSLYHDFRGITACYSGNKSVHTHIVFDTRGIWGTKGVPRSEVRQAYIELWSQLGEVVHGYLDPGKELDKALRLPELYRKLPGGHIDIIKEHIFGIPLDSTVHQSPVYERYQTRAGKTARIRLTDPDFMRKHLKVQEVGKMSRRTSIGKMDKAEHAYVLKRLQKQMKLRSRGGWPRIDRLTQESIWVCYCFANENDGNANLMWYEDARHLSYLGGKQPERMIRFNNTLGRYIEMYRAQWKRIQDGPVEDVEPVKYDPQVSVSDARNELTRLVRKALLVDKNPVGLWQTPEGAGKTTIMMSLLPEVVSQLIVQEFEDRWTNQKSKRWMTTDFAKRLDLKHRTDINAMVATNDYKMAHEKCEQFNLLMEAHGEGLRGIVVPSFSQEYKTVAGDDVITRYDAAIMGYESHLACIRDEQPEVWEELRNRHTALYKTVHGYGVVWFSAHETLQRWNSEGITSIYWHKKFFDTEGYDWWKLKKSTRLHFAIHDEINTEDLLYTDKAGMVEWFFGLKKECKTWKSSKMLLNEMYKQYLKHCDSYPVPEGMSFEYALELREKAYAKKNLIRIKENEVYEKTTTNSSDSYTPIYSRKHGNTWYAHKREWYVGLADRVVILTTEELPVAMLSAWNDGLSDDRLDKALVVHLFMPNLPMDVVDTYIMKGCTTDSAGGIVERMREEFGEGTRVITNRNVDIDNSVNHQRAKGSNQHAGRDLFQIQFYKSPDEYEVLQLINCAYDIDCAIRLSHVDSINQTAGRNLGFRGTGKLHGLVLGYRLWEYLSEVITERARYDFRLVASVKQRKDARYYADPDEEEGYQEYDEEWLEEEGYG